jgi:hypothetical protein
MNPVSNTVCPKCSGARHIYNSQTGSWDRCECLKAEQHQRLYQWAEIPKAYWQETDPPPAETVEAKKALAALAKYTHAYSWPPLHVAFYVESPQLDWFTATLVRHHVDQGRLVNWKDLDVLTTTFLTSRPDFDFLVNRPIFCIRFGMEYTQNINLYLLNYLLEHRADVNRFHSIFLSTVPKRQLLSRYGEALSGALQARLSWLT